MLSMQNRNIRRNNKMNARLLYMILGDLNEVLRGVKIERLTDEQKDVYFEMIRLRNMLDNLLHPTEE